MIAGYEKQSVYTLPTQCVIENEIIMQVDFYGNRQKIGVTDSKYQELEKISNTYYDKLVELKIIVPLKTQEELQAETMQLMNSMFEQMQSMKKELEELKVNDKSAINCKDDEPQSAGQSKTRSGVAKSAANSAGSGGQS